MTIPILKPLRWTHNYKLRKKNMKKLESLETLLFCYSLQTHLTTLHRTLSCRYFLIATVQFLFCCGVGFKKNKMNTLNQHLESRKGLFHHHPAKFTCFGSQKKQLNVLVPNDFPILRFLRVPWWSDPRGLLLVESQNSLRRRRFQIDQANSIAHRNMRSKDGCCCWYGYVANLWGIKLLPIFWAILLAI